MRSVLLLFSLALAGCSMSDELGPVAGAPTIALVNAAGASTGAVQVEHRSGGANLRIAVQGLPPGDHALHLHAVGRCDVPKFESAGPHWNPEGRQHGHLNPQGPHLGDLPNLALGPDGKGSIAVPLAGPRAEVEPVLFDADGTAIVIHAAADDHRTDPSGNSGARIACGVLTRS